jgi:hypothetical protein
MATILNGTPVNMNKPVVPKKSLAETIAEMRIELEDTTPTPVEAKAKKGVAFEQELRDKGVVIREGVGIYFFLAEKAPEWNEKGTHIVPWESRYFQVMGEVGGDPLTVNLWAGLKQSVKKLGRSTAANIRGNRRK